MPKCFKPYHMSDGNAEFTAKQLSRQKKTIRLDVMRTWFLENYCDPVYCCPHEASEGGYLYIWGGPYDAKEILNDEFDSEESENLIDTLAYELFSESPNWSPIPKPEEDYGHYLAEGTRLSDIYNEFKNSMENIEVLIHYKVEKNKKQYLYRLAYANIITALEAYLADTFIFLVTGNGAFRIHYMLHKIHKKNTSKLKKIKLSEVWSERRSKDDKKFLSCFSWHKLKDTEDLYEKVIDIPFNNYSSTFDIAIKNRHDIVHRNGKSPDGTMLILTKKEIKELSFTTKNFVAYLNAEIDKKIKNSNNTKIDEELIEHDLDFC